ncbi:Integrin alpha beta-propellor repeat-containing protein [Carpediemonas membranifera]|uniref:Integrin alpha beta-propellor repeat-containing protein n=1 Tax=Carpediemonas membranifera TaxID=201153 RepID=A0A8J6B7D4_9EUKA|nr:Integrin alpha beta-propellor repeat-containing protein [Carpediemonas membranifera]|eukprot:KAG9395809.1 Integrin alpha beta-propellor repeat-containing protein [Carpediemonas membranifera]
MRASVHPTYTLFSLILVLNLFILSTFAAGTVLIDSDAIVTGDAGSSFGQSLAIHGDMICIGIPDGTPGTTATGFVQCALLPHISSPRTLTHEDDTIIGFGASLAATDACLLVTGTLSNNTDFISAWSWDSPPALLAETVIPEGAAGLMKVSPDQTKILVASSTIETAALFDLAVATDVVTISQQGVDFSFSFLIPSRDKQCTHIAMSNTMVYFASYASTDGYIDAFTIEGEYMRSKQFSGQEIGAIDACATCVVVSADNISANYFYRLTLDLKTTLESSSSATMIAALALTPSCSLFAHTDSSTSTVSLMALGALNTPLTSASYLTLSASTTPGLGGVVAVSDDYVAFAAPSIDKVVTVPLCQDINTALTSPYDASSACLQCESWKERGDYTSCVTTAADLESSVTDTAIPFTTLAVAGNTFVRGFAGYNTDFGAVYVKSVDSFIAGSTTNQAAPSVESTVAGQSFGQAVATNGRYVVVGSSASATPVCVVDAMIDPTSLLLYIPAPAGISNFGYQTLAVHPTELIVAVTGRADASASSTEVFLFKGAELLETLAPDTPTVQFGHSLGFSESRLFIGSPEESTVYTFTLADITTEPTVTASTPITLPSVPNFGLGLCPSNDYIMATGSDGADVFVVSATRAGETWSTTVDSYASITAPVSGFDVLSNMCVIAVDVSVAVYRLDADFSPVSSTPYTPTNALPVSAVGLSPNALFLQTTDGAVESFYTTCGSPTAPYGMYSPSFHTCETCPTNTFADSHQVRCSPVPFGKAVSTWYRASVSDDYTDHYYHTEVAVAHGAAVAARDHVLAVTDGTSFTVADVDGFGMYRRGQVMTQPDSVKSTVFGSDIAVTESGHVIVGSATTAAVAHGMSVYELTHHSAVYVRSFFEYTANCEYGTAIDTHGDYVAVSAPGSACNFIDVYNTADWTKVTISGDDTSVLSMQTTDTGRHMAMDQDYLYVYATSVAGSTEYLFVVGDFGAAPTQADAVTYSADAYAYQIVPDAITDTVMVMATVSGGLTAFIYRKGQAPGEHPLVPVIAQSVATGVVYYFAGELYVTSASGGDFDIISGLLDARTGPPVSTTMLADPSLTSIFFRDSISLITSSTPATPLGLFLPSKSECAAGHEFLAPGLCRPCPDGYYSPGLQTLCTKCPPHYASNTGHTACVPDYQISQLDLDGPALAMASEGDVMVVTSKGYATIAACTSTNSGQVSIYEYDPALPGWTRGDTLTVTLPDASGATYCMGWAISLSDSWLAVTGRASTTTGIVWVYSRSGATMTYNTAFVGSPGGNYGGAVKVAGDYLFVGAVTGGSVSGGQVYIYSYSSSWQSITAIESPTPNSLYRYGYAIDAMVLEDDSLVLAVSQVPSDSTPGKVFIYEALNFASPADEFTNGNPGFGTTVKLLSAGTGLVSDGDAVFYFDPSSTTEVSTELTLSDGYVAAMGTFGDMLVASADSYRVYGHTTGALAVATDHMHPSYDLSDSGRVFPPQDFMSDNQGFGQSPMEVNDGVIFATDALSLTVTSVNPGCGAGEYADTWYSCADCPMYSTGSGLVCTDHSFTSVNANLASVVTSLAIDENTMVGYVSIAASGTATVFNHIPGDWGSGVVLDSFSASGVGSGQLGYNIALDSFWLVVSGGNAASTGTVNVYARDGDTLTLNATLLSGVDPTLVAVDGYTILAATVSTGTTLRILAFSSEVGWEEVFVNSTVSKPASSVAVSGSWAVVGFASDGSVDLTHRDDSGSWASFTTVGLGAGDFGASLALENTTLIVGAPSDGTGAIYEISFDEEVWAIGSRVSPNDPVAAGAFPSSLAIRDGHVAAGWVNCEVDGATPGCILMFDKDQTSVWRQTTRYYTTEAADFPIGFSVALSDYSIATVSDPANDHSTIVVWDADCPGGSYSDTWFSCNEASYATYAPARSLRRYLCPDGSWPDATAASCESVAYTVAVLAPDDTTAADGFGVSVSVFGDVLTVGTEAGVAHAYRVKGLMPDLYFEDIGQFTTSHPSFGSVVALCGAWLAVAAPDADDEAGSVAVFARTGYSFSEPTILQVAATASLGSRLAVYDDLLLASSDAANGTAIAFTFTDGDWSTSVALFEEGADEFGAAIAITASYIFIGAPATDQVFIYDHGLDLVQELEADNAGERFGSVLAASEAASTLLSVGSPMANVSEVTVGTTFLFEHQSTFTLIATLVHGPTLPDVTVPASLAMDQTSVVAGSPMTSIGTHTSAGAMLAFTSEGAGWAESSGAIAPAPRANEGVGHAAAMGSAVLAFAPTPSQQPGKVYIAAAVCNAGYQPSSWRSCEPCPTGSYSEAGWASCLTCPEGSTASAGQTSCTPSFTAASLTGPIDQLGSTVRIHEGTVFAMNGSTGVVPDVHQVNYDGSTSAWVLDPTAIAQAVDSGTTSAYPASFDVSEHWLALGSPALSTVCVFSRSADSFDLLDTLVFDETATSFGTSVAMTDAVLAVGAPDADSGVVAVYAFNGNRWAEQFKFRTTMSAHGDAFGSAVAVAPDSSFIAASDPATNSIVAILAYKCGLTGDVTETQLIEGGTSFGTSLAATETTIVVGTPAATVNGIPGAGTVTVLALDGDVWAISTTLEAHIPAAEAFGFSVAIADDTIVAGAPGYNDGAHVAGRAHLFVLADSGDWEFDQIIAQPASDDARLGSSVAITSLFIALGSPSSSNDEGSLTIVYQPCADTAADYMASWRMGCAACPMGTVGDVTRCQFVHAIQPYQGTTLPGTPNYGHAVAATDSLVAISTHYATGDNIVVISSNIASTAIPHVQYDQLTVASDNDFGKSLMFTDSLLFVGASSSVAVYEYFISNGVFFSHYDDLALTPAESSFGDVMLAWDDNIAIAAPDATGDLIPGAGLVVVYHYDGDSIIKIATIDLAGVSGRGADALGTSLLEHGGTLFIGAPGANTVFAVDESDWSTVTQVITATLPTATVSFGSSMAYDDVNDLLLISDPDADMFGTAQGAVVAFELDADTSEWTQLTWIRPGVADMVAYGSVLHTSQGMAFMGSTTYVGSTGTIGFVEFRSFDDTTRRYDTNAEISYFIAEPGGFQSTGVLQNEYIVSRPSHDIAGVVTRKCDAGYYASSLLECSECPEWTYSPENSRYCEPCPAGSSPNANRDGCDPSMSTSSVIPSASVAGTVHFGTTVAVYDDLLILGSDTAQAVLYMRVPSGYTEIKSFSFGATVTSVAVDEDWLAIATDGDGLYVFSVGLRTFIEHSHLASITNVPLMAMLGGQIVTVSTDTRIYSYRPDQDDWLPNPQVPHAGTTVALHPDFFIVGDGSTVYAAPWPADCPTYLTCVTDLGLGGKDALLLLEDHTIVAVDGASIEFFTMTGPAATPSWTLTQTLTGTDGDYASITSTGEHIIAGIPSLTGGNGGAQVIEKSGLTWALGTLITGSSGSAAGTTIAATDKVVALGAPATSSATTQGGVDLATAYCSAHSASRSWSECEVCDGDNTSTTGALSCELCPAGTYLAADFTCQGDVTVQELTNVNTFGDAVALHGNFLAVTDSTSGDLSIGRFDPYALTWEISNSFASAMTAGGTPSRLVVTDDFIVFGDPSFNGNVGRVGYIPRSGHIFEPSEYIATPGTRALFGHQVALNGTTLFATSGDTLGILMFVKDLADPADTGTEHSLMTWGNNFAVYGSILVATSVNGDVRIYPDFSSDVTDFHGLATVPNSKVTSIALNDEIILIGSPDDTTHLANDVSIGSVYMYANAPAAGYPFLRILTHPDLEMDSTGFGSTVALLSADDIAVGRPGDASDPSTFGQTVWFHRDDVGNWNDGLVSSSPFPKDYFAHSSVSGGGIAYSAAATSTVMLLVHDCPAGYFPDSMVSCAQCAPGSVSAASSFVCHPCPEGMTATADQTDCVPLFAAKRVNIADTGTIQGRIDLYGGQLMLIESVSSSPPSYFEVNLFIFNATTQDWSREASILKDSAFFTGLGRSATITDEHVLVGAFFMTESSGVTGSVAVYDRFSLELIQVILPPTGPKIHFGVRTCVLFDGDFIAVDNRQEESADGTLSRVGAVHIFHLDHGVWVFTETLYGAPPVANDNFGIRMIGHGSTLAVMSRASVSVFTLEDGSFTRVCTTPFSVTQTAQAENSIGLSPDGSALAVPFFSSDHSAFSVFHLNVSTGRFAVVVSKTGLPDTNTVCCAMVDSGTILVGVGDEDSGAGSVTIYHRVTDGFWVDAGALDLPDHAVGDQFGRSVFLGDSGVVIAGLIDAIVLSRYDCPAGEVATSWFECGPVPSGSIAYSHSHTRCLNGSYADDATTCLPCDAGTYQPNKGATDCTPAPAGSFVPADGLPHASPIECPLATNQPGEGESSCVTSYNIQSIVSDSSWDDRFAASVALDGDMLLVGSPSNQTVQIYRDTGAVWNRTGELSVSFTVNHFGQNMVLRESWLAVASPEACSEPYCEVGHVHMYARDSYAFIPHSTLNATGDEPGFGFGSSISLESNVLAVLSPHSTDFSNVGMAVVFTYSHVTDSWDEAPHVGQAESTATPVAVIVTEVSPPRVVFGMGDSGLVFCTFNTALTTTSCDTSATAALLSVAATDLSEGIIVSSNSHYTTGEFDQISNAGWPRVFLNGTSTTLDIEPVEGQEFGRAVAAHGTHVGYTDAFGAVHLLEPVGATEFATFADLYITDTGYTPLDGYGTALAIAPLNIAVGSSMEGHGTLHVVSRSCPAGQYATSWHSCADCAAGSYSATPGHRECVASPLGSIVATDGQATPAPCDGGRLTTETGQTVCQNCPAGFTNDANGEGHSSCLSTFVDSTTPISIFGRSDAIATVSVNSINCLHTDAEDPLRFIPLIHSPAAERGVIDPGDYTVRVGYVDGTAESTTLTIPPDFVTPETTVTVYGTTAQSVMASTICPIYLRFGAMGPVQFDRIELDSTPARCTANVTLTAADINQYFNPTLTEEDGEYCLRLTELVLADTEAFSIIIDDEVQTLVLRDNAICTNRSTAATTAVSTQAYLSADTRTIIALFDGDELHSRSETYNAVSALYAVVPVVTVVSGAMLSVLCCATCLVAVAGAVVAFEGSSLIYNRKRTRREPKPELLGSPSVTPIETLPPLPLARNTVQQVGSVTLNVPTSAKTPLLPTIRSPPGLPPISGTVDRPRPVLHPIGTPSGGLTPALGRTFKDFLKDQRCLVCGSNEQQHVYPLPDAVLSSPVELGFKVIAAYQHPKYSDGSWIGMCYFSEDRTFTPVGSQHTSRVQLKPCEYAGWVELALRDEFDCIEFTDVGLCIVFKDTDDKGQGLKWVPSRDAPRHVKSLVLSGRLIVAEGYSETAGLSV